MIKSFFFKYIIQSKKLIEQPFSQIVCIFPVIEYIIHEIIHVALRYVLCLLQSTDRVGSELEPTVSGAAVNSAFSTFSKNDGGGIILQGEKEH